MTARSRTIPTALLLAALACDAGEASAHAFLKHANPAVGSAGPAPGEVMIDFTEGVEPAFSTIVVTDANGADVTSGPPHAAGDGTRLAVPVRKLASGTYRVSWHATATDTHRTQGRFSFTVTGQVGSR